MGYTHYWRGTPNLSSAVIADIRKIIEESGVAIAGPMGTGRAKVSLAEVAFNGSEEAGEDYETFRLAGPTSFDFTKTARRPYDVVVCAVLIRVREASPKLIISSDGIWDDADEWGAARALYGRALGRETILTGLDD